MGNMDMSRFSCCSRDFRHLSIEGAFARIAESGLRKVDLWRGGTHLSLDPSESDPEAIKKAAEANGLQIANLGTYVGGGFASNDRSVQEQALKDLRRAIDLAVFFGSRSIRARAGNDDPALIDRMAPWFQRGAEYAAKYDIPMGIENHGGAINGNPEVCVELFEKVGSPYFGVLYEPANLMHAGVDYKYALGVMHKHVVHVHFKPSSGMGDNYEKCMLGEGTMDLQWIMVHLERIGYQGDIALEYENVPEPPETGLVKWYEAAKAM
jgi:sugar phosphate isomerase/epimerase